MEKNILKNIDSEERMVAIFMWKTAGFTWEMKARTYTGYLESLKTSLRERKQLKEFGEVKKNTA